MFVGRQSALMFLLGLLLAGWSAEAVLTRQGMQTQSKSKDEAADGETDDDDDDDSADGSDKDNQDDSQPQGPAVVMKQPNAQEDQATAVTTKSASHTSDMEEEQSQGPAVVMKTHSDAEENQPTDGATNFAASATHSQADEVEDFATNMVAAAHKVKSQAVVWKEQQVAAAEEAQQAGTTQTAQAPAAAPAPAPQTQGSSPAEAQQAACVAKAEAELAANKAEQDDLQQSIDTLTDEKKSDQEINTNAKEVEKETESVALGGMLGHMWKDMRMFEVPGWKHHAQEQMRRLKMQQHVLESKVADAKAGVPCQDEQPGQPAWQRTGDPTLGKPKAVPVNGELPKKSEGKKRAKKEEKRSEADEFQEFQELISDNDAAKVASKTDFWKMNAEEKETFAAGTLVYLLGGIATAFLYNKLRSRKSLEDWFVPAPESNIARNSRDFSTGLFSCFSAPKICVMGCFCPCIRWADTIDRAGFWSYWKAFFAFFLSLVLYGYTKGYSLVLILVFGVIYRQKLRSSRDLENGTFRTVAGDFLTWWCCQPCAIIQEAREERTLVLAEP